MSDFNFQFTTNTAINTLPANNTSLLKEKEHYILHVFPVPSEDKATSELDKQISSRFEVQVMQSSAGTYSGNVIDGSKVNAFR
ncbi:MAG: hypothetical protein JNL47_01535 [Bacteroidia bacterium]|nr:hypothetical protein [Bacteroidia bacterium]